MLRKKTERDKLTSGSAVKLDALYTYSTSQHSVALLDAAHRSVVNATSRARGTNEAEYARLRQCAIDKQSKKMLKRARPATAEDAAAPPQVMPTTGEWPAFLRSLEEIAPVPPLDSIQATPLNEVLPVPSTKHQAPSTGSSTAPFCVRKCGETLTDFRLPTLLCVCVWLCSDRCKYLALPASFHAASRAAAVQGRARSVWSRGTADTDHDTNKRSPTTGRGSCTSPAQGERGQEEEEASYQCRVMALLRDLCREAETEERGDHSTLSATRCARLDA